VQDFPALEEGFNTAVPDDLKSRVTFQSHDFFTPQPIKNADVYLFRFILHDWPDKYAIRILQNTVPALKNGARMIVAEMVQSPPGTAPAWKERFGTSLDMQMMAVLNSKERTQEDWEELFKKADPRFSVRNFVTPTGASSTFIEVVFTT
jgi:hypothetical protein